MVIPSHTYRLAVTGARCRIQIILAFAEFRNYH